MQSVSEHGGKLVFTDQRRFTGILADALGEMRSKKQIDSNESTRIRNLLVTAIVDLDAYTRLESVFAVGNAFAVTNLTQEMIAKYDTKEESAQAVMECIGELVGYVVEPKPVSAPGPIPTPPQSAEEETNPKSPRPPVRKYSVQELKLKEIRESLAKYSSCIAAGHEHFVGLKTDGTVVATGRNKYGQCDVSNWKNIVAVSAGSWYTVGLKADGTVVAAGDNSKGQCNVAEWRDIVAIVTKEDSYKHIGCTTYGLKADGTVVATGGHASVQRNVADWRDIISIVTNRFGAVALKADGTVVATEISLIVQRNVANWRDIVSIAGTNFGVVGLKTDGTVVSVCGKSMRETAASHAAGQDIVALTANSSNNSTNFFGLKANGEVMWFSGLGRAEVVSKLKDIVALGPQERYIKADGTVVRGDPIWGGPIPRGRDIVAMAVNPFYAIGLKKDGTIVFDGIKIESIKFDFSNWRDIGPFPKNKAFK